MGKKQIKWNIGDIIYCKEELFTQKLGWLKTNFIMENLFYTLNEIRSLKIKNLK